MIEKGGKTLNIIRKFVEKRFGKKFANPTPENVNDEISKIFPSIYANMLVAPLIKKEDAKDVRQKVSVTVNGNEKFRSDLYETHMDKHIVLSDWGAYDKAKRILFVRIKEGSESPRYILQDAFKINDLGGKKSQLTHKEQLEFLKTLKNAQPDLDATNNLKTYIEFLQSISPRHNKGADLIFRTTPPKSF